VRNAAVIGAVIGVVSSAVFDVIECIDEALSQREWALDDLDEAAAAQVPAVVIDAADLPVVRDTARAVRDALREGIDDRLQPRGHIGARILHDIENNGDLAVFERHDGILSLGHGRLTVSDLRMVLDDLVVALDEAVARNLEVVLLEDPGWPVGYYGDTPEERR